MWRKLCPMSYTHKLIHSDFSVRRCDYDFRIIDEIYDRFGPTPCLCLERAFNCCELVANNGKVERALRQIEGGNIELLVANTVNVDMDEISHMLCLIRRDSAEPVS